MTASSPRDLPAVHEVLNHSKLADSLLSVGRPAVVNAIRAVLKELRHALLCRHLSISDTELLDLILNRVVTLLDDVAGDRIVPVINATGVILHTSLGRAPLAATAIRAVEQCGRHCNLEVDLRTGERRQRGYQLDVAWTELTGAEASLVVNNNAAATLLTLQSLCQGKEVIISRGQLIEIGGSFRLPEIFLLSGSLLKEVGTTNQTHLADYAAAIGPQTAAILHVHPSNYRIVGFTHTPSIEELVKLGKSHGLLVLDDIGSGSLSDLTQLGFPPEPTFQASLNAGADIVLGSGDKLLGGPQSGIILGRKALVDRMKQHPLARAVRIDKLTLAALSATLDLYRCGLAVESIPVLQMLQAPVERLRSRAERIIAAVTSSPLLMIEIRDDVAEVGGGSFPAVTLPTVALATRHATLSANELAQRWRKGARGPRNVVSVFTRIRADAVLIDLRSVLEEQDADLIRVLQATATE